MNKMKAIRTIILLALVNLCYSQTDAQVVLSQQKCRDMAIEYNQDMKIAQKTIDKANTDKKAMRALYLPSISANGMYAYTSSSLSEDIYMPTFAPDPTTGQLDPNVLMNPATGAPVIDANGNPIFNMYAYLPLELGISGAYLAGISLEQPIYAGGKIVTANKMASIGTEIASQNLEYQRYNTISEADQAYWLYVSVLEKVKLAQANVSMLDSIIIQVKNGVEVGMLHQNDILKIQVKRNDAALMLQKAQNGLELTRMSLCHVVGLPLQTAITPTDTSINCEVQVPQQSSDISLRPDYKLLTSQLRLQEQQIKLQRANYLPTVGIKAGYSFIGGIELSGFDIETNGFNVIGSISIPIFNWGEGYQKIKSTTLKKEMQELEIEKNSQLMQMEIEQTRLNLQDALLRISLSEEALNLASENLRISRNNYELGNEVITDLLITQTQWQQASSELIEAKADFKLKQTLYLKATGNL